MLSFSSPWVAEDCQPAEINGSVCATYGNACVSKTTEMHWHWKFCSRWQEMSYKAQVCWDHIIATPKNVAQKWSVDTLAVQYCIHSCAVPGILHSVHPVDPAHSYSSDTSSGSIQYYHWII
jgi:hypothetical protein